MKKIIVPISGMHCRSCEMLIEDKLAEIPEIKHVKTNCKRGIAEIYYDLQRPNSHEIIEAIRSAGYSIGSKTELPGHSASLISENASDYKDLGIAFLFLLGGYFVLKSWGLTNINFGSLTQSSSFYFPILLGLVAGISTCMALVGGLVLSLSARHAEKHPEASSRQKFRPHIYFNLGRVSGFFLLGGILGSLGSIFQISSFYLGIMTIAVGVVMLILGLQLIEIFPFFGKIKFTLPKFISRFLGIKNHQKEYSHKNSMLVGALTFFLPCGFTQAMQLYAVGTGSFWGGGFAMGLFALGTAPGLLGIGGLTSIVKGIFAKRFFKLAGLVVILFSIFNITNGYTLTGWQLASVSNSSGLGQNNADPNVQIENGVQVVRMDQLGNGYSPNQFTIKKNAPVKWVINSKNAYSCASIIIFPKFNIAKRLATGENIIEFTPNEIGNFKFSCAMGMYTGVFNVIDTGEPPANNPPSNNSKNSATQNTSIPPDANNPSGQEQIINATYTSGRDIQPKNFTVKANAPVKFLIDVQDNGAGCMSTITIPGLYNDLQYLQKGTLEMKFTPTQPGDYYITCSMGAKRGIIRVK